MANQAGLEGGEEGWALLGGDLGGGHRETGHPSAAASSVGNKAIEFPCWETNDFYLKTCLFCAETPNVAIINDIERLRKTFC